MILAKKSENNFEQGYVFAPWIPVQTTEVVVDYTYKRILRKRKIKNILDLEIEINSPNKSISSRYSKRNINNRYYQTIQIKKST